MKKKMFMDSAYYVHKRMKKTRARAQFVGFLYFVATLALLCFAVIPTLNIEYLNVIPGLREGKMVWQDFKFALTVDTITRIIYIFLVLRALWSFFKAFNLFSWLYRKTSDGLNQPVYAMYDISKLFSSTFAFRLIGTVLILLLNGSYGVEGKFDISILQGAFASLKDLSLGINLDIPVVLAFLAVGVAFRLLCGFLGAKVSFFSNTAEDTLEEIKRELGRLVPVLRNLLQLAVVLMLAVFLLTTNKLDVYLQNALNKNFAVDIEAFLQMAILLFWIVLTAHATNDTEYNPDGALGKGMSNFKVFIIFTFLALGGLYFFHLKANNFQVTFGTEDLTLIIPLATAFVMSILEFVLKVSPDIFLGGNSKDGE